MGQYYVPVLLSETGEIVAWFSPYTWNEGSKMMEHAYLWDNNPLMRAVEMYLLSNTSLRPVWAGDYSRESYDKDGNNLYRLANEKPAAEVAMVSEGASELERRWIVNHTKRLYIDKHALKGYKVHPLPLLTQETDETAGGDYRGSDEGLLGSWAHDILSIATEKPDESYTAFLPRFVEG